MNLEKRDYSKLTDKELLVEKEKLKKSKKTHALLIGFVIGVLIFGLVSWSFTPNKQLGFLLPMLIPLFLLHRLTKKSKTNSELEEILEQRQL